MNGSQIKSFLKKLGTDFPHAQGRQGWIVACCPFARWTHAKGSDENPSFGVKIRENGKSHYYCYSCGCHGDMEDMVLEMRMHKSELSKAVDLGAALQMAMDEEEGIDLDLEEEESAPKVETITFPDYWLKSFPSALANEEAMAYLAKRGVSPAKVKAYDVRYDYSKGTVCFPVWAFDGSLVGLHGRKIAPPPGSPAYHAYKFGGHWNRLPWLGEHKIDPDQPVLFVESIFDYTAVEWMYPNTLAPLSAGMSREKVKRVSACYDVITLFDCGTGGDKARQSVSKYLDGAAIEHLLPLEEYGDPGAMPSAELYELLEPHLPLVAID